MHNELLTLGPVTIYGYGLMIAIGIIVAYYMTLYRAKKLQLSEDVIFWLAVWGLLGGFASAKILYYITRLDEIIQDPSILLNVTDGFVIYGGIIGGILSGYLYCYIKKIKFFPYFDLVMPAFAMAQGFGRIGCFLAGCCYGTPTDSPIGITFTDSKYGPNNVSLVPTQLLSSGFDFLLAFTLIYYAKRAKKSGRVAGMYLVIYSIGRFIIEFYRGDLVRGQVGALSTSQFISFFTVAAGIALVIFGGEYLERKSSK